ncbi:hypothetical protein V8F20_002837 [Naviculisporaceae sp. PSN 640]
MSQPDSPLLSRLPLEIRNLVYDQLDMPRDRLVLCLDFADSTLRSCAEAIRCHSDALSLLRDSPASHRGRLSRNERPISLPNQLFRGPLPPHVIENDRQRYHPSKTNTWMVSPDSRDWWDQRPQSAQPRGPCIRESIRDILDIEIRYPYNTKNGTSQVAPLTPNQTRLFDVIRHVLDKFNPTRLAECSYDPGNRKSPHNLLLTCRQTSHEIATLLYGGNTFVTVLDWQAGLFNFKTALRPETRQLIRKLMFLLPRGSSQPLSAPVRGPWNPNFWFNSVNNGGFLDGTLNNLTQMGIITTSSLGLAKKYKPTTMSEKQERDEGALWMLKMGAILPYLTEGLNPEATVLADTNNENTAVQAIRGVFGQRVKFKSIVAADYLGLYRPKEFLSYKTLGEQEKDWYRSRPGILTHSLNAM